MLVWGLEGMRAKLYAEKSLLSKLYLALYVNSYTPTPASEVDDFVEASFPGYERIKLDRWGTPAVNSASSAIIVEVVRKFTWTGSGPGPVIQGVFTVDEQGDNYYFGEKRVEGPFTFSEDDREFTYLPRMVVRNIS